MKLFERFRKNILLYVVFVTGACVLVIEVVAIRILSPYFGNTIYTYSSVLSVVLASLSIGYYLGGKYADKNPKEELFYKIILFSGIATYFTQLLNLFVLPSIAYDFSIIYGPLVSSIILFIVPSFLLGTLSPFAIKLQSVKSIKIGIGNVSGQVFFYSTLGSILGSLLSGFYLIPNFGVDTIMLGTASALTAIGLLGIKNSKKKLIKHSILPFFLLLLLLLVQNEITNPSIIFSKDGVYEKISVVDLENEDRPARFLNQDRSSSAAIYLDTGELFHSYSKYYNIYQAVNPGIKNALFIGGGAYVMPNALLSVNDSVDIDVVEIEPSLYQISKDYFGVSDSPRLHNYIEDGRWFLAKSDKKYDLIFGDAYFSLYSVPIHLTTVEFFELVKDRLNINGVFVANLIGDLSRRDSSFLFSEVNTLLEVFPNNYLFAVDDAKILSPQNFIFLGINGDKKLDFGMLNQSDNELFNTFEEKQIDLNRFNYYKYLVFNDNFAPVESSVSDLIKRNIEEEKLYLNGNEMIAIIDQITSYGSRYLGSDAKKDTERFIEAEIRAIADEVIVQDWNESGYEFKNIIARLNSDADERIILGTHYDSKKFADRDKDGVDSQGSVPGANDSASGVSVLIELARYLSLLEKFNNGVDFVFFDGEEGLPDLENNNWEPLGSNYFADHISDIYGRNLPKEAIIIDMVCDSDLDIYIEKSSYDKAPEQSDRLFNLANSMHPQNFHKEVKYQIDDDHSPLNSIGIPSTLLIDFDYPYFHTTEDTLDKCSSMSLEKIGEVLKNYIIEWAIQDSP
jgi:spermidine synthase